MVRARPGGHADRGRRGEPGGALRGAAPDLREHEVFQGYWKKAEAGGPRPPGVAKRMSFAATLEFGLSSRLGRTLELTGTSRHTSTSRRSAVSPMSAVAAGRPPGRPARPRRRRPGAHGAVGARRRRAHPDAGRHRPSVAADLRRDRQPLQHLGWPPAPGGHARLPEGPSRSVVPHDGPLHRAPRRRHRNPGLVLHLDGPRPGRPGGRRIALRARAARRPRRRRRTDHAAGCRRQRRVADPAEARAAHPDRRHAQPPCAAGCARRGSPGRRS